MLDAFKEKVRRSNANVNFNIADFSRHSSDCYLYNARIVLSSKPRTKHADDDEKSGIHHHIEPKRPENLSTI